MKKSYKSEFYPMKIIEFVEKIRERAILIDMLFIDADRSKKSVLDDFQTFFSFVMPHGLILVHDTHPRNKDFLTSDCCYDGYLPIQDLSTQTCEYELITIPIH
jgi:hypothetical protein